MVHFASDTNNESVVNTLIPPSVCFTNDGEYPNPNATLTIEYVSKALVESYCVTFKFAAVSFKDNYKPCQLLATSVRVVHIDLHFR